LSCLIGSGKILQAIARDNLLFFLKPFAKQQFKDDEPRLAIIVVWLICQV